MSNVRKNEQSPHRFTTLDIILDLYEHTTTLTANEKVFDRTFSRLIDRIDDESAMVYHLCRTANEDYDNRKQDEAKIRLELQEQAIEQCMWLKTDIRLAQRRFHLRAKKAIYWNGLVNKAMEAIKGWHQAELRTYRQNFGL